MLDFTWKESRVLCRWGAPDFLARALVVGLLAVLFLMAHAGTSLAQSPPVAAYSFDEGSGTTVKDSARNHDGTISGATWASVGKYGSALDFDGVNDLVSIADAADLDLTSNFTLEAWVRPDTITGARPVIAKSESAGGNSGYLLSARYTANPTGFVASSGTTKSVARPSPLPEAVWSHLAFTSDGTNLRLYVDGKLAATAPAIVAKATAASLVIGYGQVLGGYFDGMIDEVRLYTSTLSEGEIQADRDTAVGLDQIPVAAYSFDEGSGTTLKDSIGSHDGTVSGATWTTGKYGSALDFDGVNDVVSIADAADLDLTGTFTLEAWVRPDSLAAARPVVSKIETSGGNSGYMLSAKYTSNSAGYVASSGTAAEATAPTALPTGAWSHLAATSDGTNLRLYVDGKLVATKAAISAKATSVGLEIGHSALGGYFDGQVDEVRIYNELLSESQIQTDRDNSVEPPPSTEVTTSVLDTGPSAELVSSVPITSTGTDTVVYSLPISSMKTGEVLRATGNLEVTNQKTYDITDAVRIVLGPNPSDGGGTVVTPWSRVLHASDMLHWTLPITGLYRAAANVGTTQYLKVVLKASSAKAKAGDTLIVQPNFGRLAATRYTPAVGPMAQPTHELQPFADPMPEQITQVPVDSVWRRVLTRRINDLSVNDIVDIAGQLEVQNTSGTTVQLESMVKMTTGPYTTGSTAAPVTIDRLTPNLSYVRMVHTNQLTVSDPAKRYMNLLVRAVPVGASPQPVTISTGSSALNLMRMEPNLGDPIATLREGTAQVYHADFYPDVTSIPFAVAGGSQKRVVASAPLWGGIEKGEVLRARGLVTGDLNGGEVAQVLTQLILANSPTDTTGEVVATLSGDKVPAAMQLHTSVKEGVFVMPKAEDVSKYLNFVVYASQANPSGSMGVPSASVSFTRSQPSAPLDEGFESGLDSLFRYEYDGTLSTSSAVAREGANSMLVDVDFSNDDGPEVRRVEARPPNERTAGGYEGEETWHGFSVYFPEEFDAPAPAPGAKQGTWNIFTQLHHINDGLDCTTSLVPPIAFNVRHYKAGAYTNPGESETATPIEGDYIEVGFNGGQIATDCQSAIIPTKTYVIAPLQHKHWYDIVLHTRWRLDEGTGEKSNAEVWLDGNQVLGDETTPVLTPNLYWHGTLAVHNSSSYLQFGLYRGPSLEDPPVKLYIDAVRRGSSYAEVAPGQ